MCLTIVLLLSNLDIVVGLLSTLFDSFIREQSLKLSLDWIGLDWMHCLLLVDSEFLNQLFLL